MSHKISYTTNIVESVRGQFKYTMIYLAGKNFMGHLFSGWVMSPAVDQQPRVTLGATQLFDSDGAEMPDEEVVP